MTRRNRTPIPPGWLTAAALGVALAAVPSPAQEDAARAIAALKAVGREGKANDAAAQAWKTLVQQGGPALFPALRAIDDSNPTAANWLRTAVDAIAENEEKAGRPLPKDQLETFATDTKFTPSARRLAYELLLKADPSAKDRLLPGFLNDPSPELRRDAVAAELDKIEKAARPTAKAELEKVFTSARDKDQVESIARKLETDYKTKVSVTEHFAFITHWQLAGPFDSAEGKALTVSHPPEQATDATGTFKGKDGAEVGWKAEITGQRYGLVDLNKTIGKHKNAAVYALARLDSEKEVPCEVRVGTTNALQIFLNGKKLFEREEYHHGLNMDYNVGKGTLTAGPNVLVLKVCQNDQKEDFAQNWLFQARVCDATGGAIPGVTQRVTEGDRIKSIKLGFIPEGLEVKEPKEEKK